MMVIAHQEQPQEQWRTGVDTRMHVSAQNGASQLCIFEQWVAPSAGAPTHWHSVEEVLTILSGRAKIWIDKEHRVLVSGQSLIVPAYRRHGFENIGPETLHVHAVLASAIFEAMLAGREPVRRWLAQNKAPVGCLAEIRYQSGTGPSQAAPGFSLPPKPHQD